ncbi:hypothetical protein [Spirosoma litoris]
MNPTLLQMQADLRSLIEQQHRVEALVKVLVHSTQTKRSSPESASVTEPTTDSPSTESVNMLSISPSTIPTLSIKNESTD